MIATSVDARLIRRARGEFLEMPGLRLTFQQARRLWGLDEETCASLLDTLVVSGFLVRGDDEQYVRAFDGEPLDVLEHAQAAASGSHRVTTVPPWSGDSTVIRP